MAKETSTKKPPEQEGPRSFNVFLNHLADGEAELELSRQLQSLIKDMRAEAIARNGKIKGTLAVALKFTIGATGPVAVTYDVTTKAPKRVTSEGHFWITAGGNLSHTNPKQETLPGMRVVEPPPPALDIEDEERPAPREA